MCKPFSFKINTFEAVMKILHLSDAHGLHQKNERYDLC